MQGGIPEAYADFVQGVFTAMGQSSSAVTHAVDVAETVWQAANDLSFPVRISAGAGAGADAAALAELR
jgi:hypothetical protein